MAFAFKGKGWINLGKGGQDKLYLYFKLIQYFSDIKHTSRKKIILARYGNWKFSDISTVEELQIIPVCRRV